MPEVSVALLPGDGIGPEVVAEARPRGRRDRAGPRPDDRLARAPDGRRLDRRARHGAHRRGAARRAPAPTPSCSARSAGPSGTPPTPTSRAPSRGCSACARASASTPTCARCAPGPALYDASPLRRERIEGTDLLVVRELTGGLYFGERGREPERAFDTCVYTKAEVRAAGRVGLPRRRRAAAARSPRSTRPTCSRPRACGASRSSRPPRATRTSRSSTCWSTTPRCSWSAARPTST